MERFTTANLPEQEQFSYWREVLCQTYIALDTTRATTRAGFFGEVRAEAIGAINVTTISSTRQVVHRGRSEISRMPREVYFLNLQTRGQCRMHQGGRATLLRPGEFALVDSTEPYTNDYCSDDWEQHSFRIPRHLLHPLLNHPQRCLATKFGANAGIENVTVEYLTSIAENAIHLPTVEIGSHLAGNLVGLIALAIGGKANACQQGRGAARRALYASIRKYVDLNVADPDLCPTSVACYFDISPRYLHKILEEGGRSFGRLLLESRLERCAADLGGGCKSSITDIALRWGFNDLSHFSRSFQQRYGVSARDFRHTPQVRPDERPQDLLTLLSN